MNHLKSSPLLLAAGAALVIAALLFIGFELLPAAQSGTVSATVYVATTELSVGTTIGVGELKTTTLQLPPGFADDYLSPTNLGNYTNDLLTSPVANGALIPTTDLSAELSATKSGVAIGFKNAPSLAVGDVVNIFITLSPASTGGQPTEEVLLRNITLEAAVGNGDWLISVPTSISSAVLYASDNSDLDAALVQAGNKSGNPPAVNSLQQALAIIRRSGES